MEGTLAKKENPIVALRKTLGDADVKKQFENALKNNADLFMASITELVSTDKSLQACSPNDVIRESLKAAVLKLPLNKQLGFAYIVPFKDHGTMKPNFIIGYKGLIQLAVRTGQYKYINAGEIHEKGIVKRDIITGETTITGKPKDGKVVGYFAYIELTNGFKKLLYKTKAEITEHAKKYSKSYGSSYSPWKTEFDKMAEKTVLRELIGTYGIKSIEFLNIENEDVKQEEEEKPITVESEPVKEEEPVSGGEEKTEPDASESGGPGF